MSRETDLLRVKLVAHTLLDVQIQETALSPVIVSHPFTNSGISALRNEDGSPSMQDTYAALILPNMCTAYNIFLMKQFTSSIPTEIIESAKIDGCSQPRIFASIVVPLSKTVLAVMAITTFMDNWNSFFWPMLITTKEYMKTIQVGLASFRFANTTYFAPMMAGACVAALPMFILFFCLQRYFLEGVTVGAVKG